MAKVDPDSRASQVKRAETVLTRLLRTPKTRNGLVAAVASKMISRRFVFGWLANQVMSGGVIKLKSGGVVTFQIKGQVIVETPRFSGFPSWLDPRVVPVATVTRVFIDGKPVDPNNFNQER